jgi:hypothetical protein
MLQLQVFLSGCCKSRFDVVHIAIEPYVAAAYCTGGGTSGSRVWSGDAGDVLVAQAPHERMKRRVGVCWLGRPAARVPALLLCLR